MGGSGTRIASISGLRGVVGDGLDPAVAVEFAAAYAGGCKAGPIVVGHDGRVSAPVFSAAVAGEHHGDRPRRALRRADRHADDRLAGSRPRGGRRHPDLGFAQPAQVQRLEVLPAGGHGAEPGAGPGDARPLATGASFAGRAGNRWARFARSTTPIAGIWRPCWRSSTSPAIRGRGVQGRARRLPRGRRADGSIACSRPSAAGRSSWAASPTGATTIRRSRPRPNLQEFAAIVPAIGAAVGFAQDPDADRLAIVDETGRYIGEELTLALAAARRLGQEKGPVILNLSTSRVTETLARAAGCAVFRTPVGEINVVERMVAVNAVLGGEGNGGVIDPRVGYVRDSFVGMAMVLDLMAATGEPLSRLVAGLPRYRDGQGPVSAGFSKRPATPDQAIPPARSPHSGTGSRPRAPTPGPTAATDCGSTGTIAGCTSAPATPSRSSG